MNMVYYENIPYFMARYSDSENPSNGLSGELIVT